MIDAAAIRALLQRVPLPPEDVMPRAESMPAGVSDEACDGFEQRTGIRLPQDMRDWLKIANGACVGPGGLFGIQPVRSFLDIERRLELYPSWKLKKWIPIAGDGCGNYFVLVTAGEYGDGAPVVFMDVISSGDTPDYIVASDIHHFLIAILEEELGAKGWPCNEQHVTKSDPRIKSFTGVRMGWDG